MRRVGECERESNEGGGWESAPSRDSLGCGRGLDAGEGRSPHRSPRPTIAGENDNCTEGAPNEGMYVL